MPIYNYSCETKPKKTSKPCGHEYEVFYQNQAAVEREEPTEACPKCSGLQKRRLVNTGTSFILKGSGWAKDRYGK